MNFSEGLSLDTLRSELIKLEDSILFSLMERASFHHNPIIYVPGAFDFPESFLLYFLHSVESVHAKVRRYTSPDQVPFTCDLPSPVIAPLPFPSILAPNTVNVNQDLLRIYQTQIVPCICLPGDDLNYGSSATKDVEALQILSHRIHLGKFVAEAKFNDPKDHQTYVNLIKSQDSEGLMALLTNTKVEEKLLARLCQKAVIFGQEIVLDDTGKLLPPSQKLKISVDLVTTLFKTHVIPLTKRVEVEYLLRRLDSPFASAGFPQ